MDKYSIYCDMDGVLVNFDKGYHELTGQWPGKPGDYQKGPEDFWAPVKKAGKEFWENLEWMPGGMILWKYIKEYNPILLSSPSRDESSRWGKKAWVNYWLPGVDVLFKKAEEKAQYSCPTCILIDDRDDTINSWNKAGGIGILHTSAIGTIKDLQQLGI